MKQRVVAAALMAVAVSLGAQDGGLAAGIAAMQAGDFRGAVPLLESVVSDPALAAYHGDAYLLIAKAQIAVGGLGEAAAALEHYLLTFPKHRGYPEGVYLKGRLLYLQGEYESSLVALQQFLKSYPDSPFAANATYWAGEALFALGRLEEALVPLRAVVRRWPDSAKAEAAAYRASVIDLHKREAELLKLLKSSHQEALKTIEEFQQREAGYQQAIAAYQRRLSGEGTPADRDVVQLEQRLADRERELQSLRSQVEALSRQVAELKGEPAAGALAGPAAGAGGATAEQRARLLRTKEQALDLKGRLMNRLGGEGR